MEEAAGGSDPHGGEGTGLGIDEYVDLADRCEHVIGRQFETIQAIDSRAEHVTRLVILVLGILFAGMSILAQLNTDISAVTGPVSLGTTLGLGSLLVAMLAGIVTLISTRLRIGLGPDIPLEISGDDRGVSSRSHMRNVVGTYGLNMVENRGVIERNGRRYRFALAPLATAVLYLAVSMGLFLVEITTTWQWLILAVTTLIATTILWYILAGKFITAPA